MLTTGGGASLTPGKESPTSARLIGHFNKSVPFGIFVLFQFPEVYQTDVGSSRSLDQHRGADARPPLLSKMRSPCRRAGIVPCRRLDDSGKYVLGSVKLPSPSPSPSPACERTSCMCRAPAASYFRHTRGRDLICPAASCRGVLPRCCSDLHLVHPAFKHGHL